jgi:hypothetical protein
MFKAPLALFQRGPEPVNLDLYLRLSFLGPYAVRSHELTVRLHRAG